MIPVLHLETSTNTDWFQPILVVDGDGNALNLTGAVIHIGVKNKSGTEVLAITQGNGVSVTSVSGGEFDINVDVDTMSTISDGVYDYDILIERDGIRQSVARGTLTIRKGVTDWPS